MSNFNIKLKGEKDFIRALKRNPRKVKQETGDFIQRAMAVYKRGIRNNPWDVGSSGGGVPVDTSNLRDLGHNYDKRPWEGVISVDTNNYEYGEYVHEGTKYMEARPWLEYVFDNNQRKIRELQDKMLNNITQDLAK